MYSVKKRYGHELGLSACFRQHRATSHCRFLHGYALSFEFTFTSDKLDANGWVIDFGSLKPLKEWLCETFDHKLLVAEDDPQRKRLEFLKEYTNPFYKDNPKDGPVADILVVPAVGCEAFAKMAWDQAEIILHRMNLGDRVWLRYVEVREHGANGVVFTGDN